MFVKAADIVDKYINRAKSILHNHDITDITTLTTSGQTLKTVFTDIHLLLGIRNIEFYLKDAKITNIKTISGKKFSVSVLDSRNRLSGHQKRKYPVLTQEEKFSANFYLNTMKNKNIPLKEVYDNLTLDDPRHPRYFIYTPPKETDSFSDILSQLTSEAMLFPQQKNSSNKRTLKIIAEHTGINLDREEITFQEMRIPADNDCALHCLELTRKEAQELLLGNSSNEEIRKMVANEIFAALIEGTMPEKIQQNKNYSRLHRQYFNICSFIDALVGELNDDLGVQGITAEQLVENYDAEENPKLTALKRAMEEFREVKEEILIYTSSEEAFNQFARFYVGQAGQWLSYIRGVRDESRTTSLDAIARLKGINLNIWIKDPQTQKLYMVHTFNGGGDKEVDMLHTAGLTHFNLLRKK